MNGRLIVVLLITTLLTACTVGPKYQRPRVQTPAVYRGVADPNVAPDPQTLADTKWFEVFKDDKLQELIRAALVSNYDLREAVARVSLDAGETVALIGANGAGKSSTLKAIMGMAHYTRGRILLDGTEMKDLKPSLVVRRGVGYSPEGRRVFPQRSVADNLKVGGISRPQNEIAPRIEQIYAYFPRLGERASQRAGSLSGGEQQMLAIGRALMSKPTLLMSTHCAMSLNSFGPCCCTGSIVSPRLRPISSMSSSALARSCSKMASSNASIVSEEMTGPPISKPEVSRTSDWPASERISAIPPSSPASEHKEPILFSSSCMEVIAALQRRQPFKCDSTAARASPWRSPAK